MKAVSERLRIVHPGAALERRAGDWGLDFVVRLSDATPFAQVAAFFADAFWVLYEGGLRRGWQKPDAPHRKVLEEALGGKGMDSALVATSGNLYAALVVAHKMASVYEELLRRLQQEEKQQKEKEEKKEKEEEHFARLHSDDEATMIASSLRTAASSVVAQAKEVSEAIAQMPGGEIDEEAALGGGAGLENGSDARGISLEGLAGLSEVWVVAEVLAELGRVEGVLERARRSVKKTGVVGRIGMTGNLMRALPSEVGLLASSVHPILRARQLQKAANSRLVGMDWGEAKRRGAVLVLVDKSGSMGKQDVMVGKRRAMRFAISQALALAIIRSVVDDGRLAWYGAFDARLQKFVKVETRADGVEALSVPPSGGTRIVVAVREAVRLMAHEGADDADIILITDAEDGDRPEEVRAMWAQAREAIPGLRLRMVFVAGENPTTRAFDAQPGVRAVALPAGEDFARAVAEFAAEVLEEDDEEEA